MDILSVLKEKYPAMTKKQKQIADFMMEYPERMTFITLKELSKEVDATEVTILKACSEFGYQNFNEVKYEFRRYVSMQESLDLHKENGYPSPAIPEYDLNEKEKLLQAICNEEKECLHHLMSHVDIPKVMEAARQLVSAKRIILCGRGISTVLAMTLRIWLGSSGIPSIVMNTELNDEIHSILPLIQKDTVVVVFSFPDYYFMTTKVAEFSKKSGAKVIVITNMQDAPPVQYADICLTALASTRLFLNTLSTPMSLVNLLASAVEIETNANGGQMHVENDFARLFRS